MVCVRGGGLGSFRVVVLDLFGLLEDCRGKGNYLHNLNVVFKVCGGLKRGGVRLLPE